MYFAFSFIENEHLTAFVKEWVIQIICFLYIFFSNLN